MTRPRWLQFLTQLGLEFWLPLPLIGLMFFLGTGWLTAHVLSHSYGTTAQLQADSTHQIEFSVSLSVMSIEAKIDRRGKSTEVKVFTADSMLKQMEFEFPFTDYEQIDAAIAKYFKLSQEAVKELIRYRLDS